VERAVLAVARMRILDGGLQRAGQQQAGRTDALRW
jgi:hypothetical protein